MYLRLSIPKGECVTITVDDGIGLLMCVCGFFGKSKHIHTHARALSFSVSRTHDYRSLQIFARALTTISTFALKFSL